MTKGFSNVLTYTNKFFKKLYDDYLSDPNVTVSEQINYVNYPNSGNLVDINILVMNDFYADIKTIAKNLSNEHFA
jgi:hypothetical protein